MTARTEGTIITLCVCIIGIVFVPGDAHAELTRNLSLGASGQDVRELQQLLNADPQTQLTQTGSGAPGQETTYFGPLTEAAVRRFQTIHADTVLTPLGLSAATGYVGPSTRVALGTSAGTANTTTSSLYERSGGVETGVLTDNNPERDALVAFELSNFNAENNTNAPALANVGQTEVSTVKEQITPYIQKQNPSIDLSKFNIEQGVFFADKKRISFDPGTGSFEGLPRSGGSGASASYCAQITDVEQCLRDSKCTVNRGADPFCVPGSDNFNPDGSLSSSALQLFLGLITQPFEGHITAIQYNCLCNFGIMLTIQPTTPHAQPVTYMFYYLTQLLGINSIGGLPTPRVYQFYRIFDTFKPPAELLGTYIPGSYQCWSYVPPYECEVTGNAQAAIVTVGTSLFDLRP